MSSRPARSRLGARAGLVLLSVLAPLLSAGPLLVATPARADDGAGGGSGSQADSRALYLVTLRHPGLAAADSTGLGRLVQRPRLLVDQQRLLDLVGSPRPVYQWTSALDGFAVELGPGQAAVLQAQPDVALVERNEIRPLAAVDRRTDSPSTALGARVPRHGGAGEVIGFVDTGLAPDSPLFAQLPDAPARGGMANACDGGEDWSRSDCNGKVVAARFYARGFGSETTRSSASSLSALDTDGHGTQVASIAAGNAQVPVRVAGERLGRYGGMAPDAQIGVYKACWSAPEPRYDGCATADLVAAIDQATADGVDVLNLSVGGPDRIDTVERALLGATEGGIVVVAAAGNEGSSAFAAHPSPWVTTVGATTGSQRRGRLVVRHGPRLLGAMLSQRGLGGHRLVLASRLPAPGHPVAEARVCTPGSLDAARVAGAVVVCERGGVARVAKSDAVALADGAGMVLVNTGPGSIDADVQAVPTVHLDAADGRTLTRFVARHPSARAALRPAGVAHPPMRATHWSSPGDVRAPVLKPDVVAPGTALLGAVPGGPHDRWDFLTGTSASAAYTSGVAASLLSRPGWTPDQVRSALATTADPVRGSVLRTGSGLVRPDAARRPVLAVLERPAAYRAWLEGRRAHLNLPSILLSDGVTRARRTLTNTSGRALYFSSATSGLRSRVEVTPAAVRLDPGESATFTVRLLGPAPTGPVDDGYVLWRGATGSLTRLPVVVAR